MRRVALHCTAASLRGYRYPAARPRRGLAVRPDSPPRRSTWPAWGTVPAVMTLIFIVLAPMLRALRASQSFGEMTNAWARTPLYFGDTILEAETNMVTPLRLFCTGLLAVGGLSLLVYSPRTLPKAYAVTDTQPTGAIVTKSQVTKMQPMRDVSSDAAQAYCKYILTLPRDKQGSVGELCRR
jgi:hypothetical protein